MKVRVSMEDEDTICRTVVARLSGKHGISFEEIARTAYDEGRGRLATQVSIFSNFNETRALIGYSFLIMSLARVDKFLCF